MATCVGPGSRTTTRVRGSAGPYRRRRAGPGGERGAPAVGPSGEVGAGRPPRSGRDRPPAAPRCRPGHLGHGRTLTVDVHHHGRRRCRRRPPADRGGGSRGRSAHTFTGACPMGLADGRAGHRAAEQMLAPAADRLATATDAVLVPWGAAHAAPLHALPLDNVPLLDRVPVSYLPAASLLAEPGPRPPGGTLARGDPEAMSWRAPGADEAQPFAPLPSARLEAAAVAALHLGTTPLLGPDAALRRVLPRAPRLDCTACFRRSRWSSFRVRQQAAVMYLPQGSPGLSSVGWCSSWA